MAYIVGETVALPPSAVAETNYSVALSSLGLELQADDYVLIGVLANYVGAQTVSETSGGATTWDTSGRLNDSFGVRMWLTWAKVAAGPTISDPTFTLSSSATARWHGFVQVWRDADATTFKDSIAATYHGNISTGNITTTAMTPTVDDCAIVYFVGTANGTSGSPLRFLSDKVVGEMIRATDTDTYTSFAVGTVQQGTKAATAQTCYSMQTQRYGSVVLAIKNKAGGYKQKDARAGITKMAWFGDFGALAEAAITWGKLSDMVSWTSGQIAGITVDSVSAAPTAGTVIGNDPNWGGFTTLASSRNTASEWVGGYYSLPASVDMTGKIFSIEWFFQNLGAQIGAQGAIVAFADASGNAKVFKVAPKSAMEPGLRKTSFIDLANGTAIHSEGTGAPWSAVTKFGIGYHRSGSSGTSRTIAFRNALLHGNTVMTGGSPAYPLNVTYLAKALNGWGYGSLCERLGDSVMVKTPIQFGDGSTPTYVDTTATLLATPAEYGEGTQPYWNVPANAITIGLKAASGDAMNFIASAMAAGAGAEQNFTIDPATIATGNYSFQGEVVSNFLFSGDTDVPIVGATFSGCDEVAFGGADITNVTITNTTSTDAACSFDANGGSMTGCTIDGTGALYAIELGASVTAIALADCTITAGSTDKVHVLATTGTVTITISGTTSLVAGDVTSAGATVVIAAPSPTLDATVLANTRVVLYNRTTDAEISNTLVAGTSWTHTVTSGASSGNVLDLYTFKEGYQESVATIIYTGADATFAVEQAVDDAIDYYRTTESITDYTTLTEFNFYAPSIYIQSNDTDGATSLKRMFIFYNGALTTEDGARYMRGGITFRSAFDVVINRSVVPVAVDNVSATLGLYFTDESTIRVTTDDGTSWIAPPSAPGSIRYAFGVAPGQIETGVSGLTGTESAQLLALPGAAAIATAVWDKTLP